MLADFVTTEQTGFTTRFRNGSKCESILVIDGEIVEFLFKLGACFFDGEANVGGFGCFKTSNTPAGIDHIGDAFVLTNVTRQEEQEEELKELVVEILGFRVENDPGGPHAMGGAVEGGTGFALF